MSRPTAATARRPVAVLGPSSPRTAAAVRACGQILSPPPREYSASDAPAAVLVLDFGQGGPGAAFCQFDAILDLPTDLPAVAVAVAAGPRGFRPPAVLGLCVADWLTALAEAGA